MSKTRITSSELTALLQDLQRDYPHWQQGEIISQLRRTMADYTHGIWSIALPFNRGDSELPEIYRQRFAMLRQQAVATEKLDLGHVLTSIDVRQSLDLIRDAYASWAGDLGTHVLANLTRQVQVRVGSPDSMAGLADLQGDMDGDNIARHMPEGQAVAAVVAYYTGDETIMNGVTVRNRYTTFARDMRLLDENGNLAIDKEQVRQVFHGRTREFIQLDELNLDLRNPLKLLRDLFDREEQAQIDDLLTITIDQFLNLLAAGLEREQV
jgi:hypothetical protein